MICRNACFLVKYLIDTLCFIAVASSIKRVTFFEPVHCIFFIYLQK